MLDPIALLQSLTLPAGATSGARIVLDGVNGRIDVYDSAGLLRERISAASAEYQVSSGDASETALGNLQALVSGAGATRQLEIVLETPSFTGRLPADLVMLSDSFDGTVKTLIRAQARTFNVVSPDATTADIQREGVTLPRGKIDHKIVTADQTGITTETDLTGLSIAFTAVAGRKYRATADAMFDSNTANDIPTLWLTDGANTHLKQGRTGVLTGIGQQGKAILIYSNTVSISGATTWKLRAVRNAGASTIAMRASATDPASLLIEDIGPL